MRRELDDQSARRKRLRAFRLRDLVDGVERAGLGIDDSGANLMGRVSKMMMAK
jgi:hypothetical protein